MKLVAFTLICLVGLAGCSGNPEPRAPMDTGTEPEAVWFSVECRVLNDAQGPLAGATCGFEFPSLRVSQAVDDAGKAVVQVKSGESGRVQATAPGHASKHEGVQVDGPKRITFTLVPTTQPPQNESSSSTSSTPAPEDVAPKPVVLRSWTAPIRVYGNDDGGYVSEPMLDISPAGTILYAPNSYGQGPFRSRDGGISFEDLATRLGQSLPTLRTDTSIDVAPDGTIWYACSILDLANVMACSSPDEGDTWTCNEWAMPGPTDRMWIVGVNGQVAYLQALIPMIYVGGPAFAYYHAWFKTTDGGATWLPYATTQDNAFPSGNMVYDETSNRVMQVERVDANLAFIHVNEGLPVIDWKKGFLPDTTAIPWLAAHNGTLWTTAEPKRSDGSRGLVVARSTDHAATWTEFTIPTETGTVAFSYASAGPHGRVAAVYYGSEVAKAPHGNGGTWGVYVVETSNGLDPFPTWVETRVVEAIHVGSVCISAECETAGDDPYARFSLDLIGVKVDDQGNAHIAYVSDLDNHRIVNWYARQHVQFTNPVSNSLGSPA